MSYAQHRKIIDADSHVIELDDFLIAAAKEEDKSLIPAMSSQKELQVIQEGLDRGRELFAKRQEDPSVMAKFEDSILDNRKSGWNRRVSLNKSFNAKWKSPTSTTASCETSARG